jgi:regulator of sigma E protease
MDFMHTLFYFLLTIGILVAFHEFGHFWVARRAGVKVLRFAVGFGKVLWSYQKNEDSTEYVLCAIPLGGYVKMVDEREGEVVAKDLAHAFNRQSVFARFAIVAAGPIFNLVLAVALFWSVLVIGETGMKPVLGKVPANSLAAQAGFVEGDEIIAVSDKITPTWTETMSYLIARALDGDSEIAIKVQNIAQSTPSIKTLHLSPEDSKNPETLYEHLGFKPYTPILPAIIGNVLADSPAQKAGLQAKDKIINADGIEIKEWMQWVAYIKERPNTAIQVLIERADVRATLTITPNATEVAGKTEGKIGASVFVPENLLESMSVEYRLSPIEAIPVAFTTTYDYAFSTLKMLGKMFAGKADVENLSGPISIAQYAGQSASMGLTPYLKFIALISISLGVINLLPIPVLDGGHLLFFVIEAIKGSPVSEKIQIRFQQVGITLLVSLMVLAMVLDVQKLFH